MRVQFRATVRVWQRAHRRDQDTALGLLRGACEYAAAGKARPSVRPDTPKHHTSPLCPRRLGTT